MMNISNKQFWITDDLGNAFQKTLHELERALHEGKIPRFFSSSCNLLASVDKEKIKVLARYLRSVRMTKEYEDMLDANRFRNPKIDIRLQNFELTMKEFLIRTKKIQNDFIDDYSEVEKNISRELKNALFEKVKNETGMTFELLLKKTNLPDNLRFCHQGLGKPKAELCVLFGLDGCQLIPINENEIVLKAEDLSYHQAYSEEVDNERFINTITFSRLIIGWMIELFNNSCGFGKNYTARVTRVTNSYIDVSLHLDTYRDQVSLRITPALLTDTQEILIPPTDVTINSPWYIWKEYTGEKIKFKTTNLDKLDNGCRLKVLEVLLSLCPRCALGQLPNIVIISAVMTIKDHHGWSEGNCAKMLEKTLLILEENINQHYMASPFETGVNLLDSVDDDQAEGLLSFLTILKKSGKVLQDMLE